MSTLIRFDIANTRQDSKPASDERSDT